MFWCRLCPHERETGLSGYGPGAVAILVDRAIINTVEITAMVRHRSDDGGSRFGMNGPLQDILLTGGGLFYRSIMT